MGLPTTTMIAVNDEHSSSRPPPPLPPRRATAASACWSALLTTAEFAVAAVTILAIGMLFSTAFVPDAGVLRPNRSEPLIPEEAPPFSPWETTTTTVQTTTAEPESPPDLPDLIDTSDWPDSSPDRQQPYLEALAALNFTRPVRSSSDYRLSGADEPSLYEVALSVRIRGVDGEAVSKIEGSSRTHFTRAGNASNTVELHAFGLYITPKALTCDDRSLTILRQHRNDVKQTLVVLAQERIGEGARCVLELIWKAGGATTDAAGAYETWYTRDDNSTSVGLATHGETMHTRKWMPCFDEPRFKVPLQLSIEHPSHLTALSNAPVVSIEKASSENRSITSFEQTWPISTYIYAFSVTDCVKKKTIVDGLPVAAYVPPPLSDFLPNLLKDVLDVVSSSLKMFNAPNINKKMDFVFIPDHTSAMENPGHISLGVDFIDAKGTLVHEMMHQYFGNLITLEWWSDLWINEGLANFYEDVLMAKGNETWLLNSLRTLRVHSMDTDVYDTSLPLHARVHTFLESRMMFRACYNKGGIVLNMLRDYIGKVEFDAAIEKMLNERANSTLSLAQFYGYLRGTGRDKGENAEHIARTFFEQINFPLLLVRHINNATVIRQVRFHRGFVDPKQRDFDTRWTIPIHLISLDGKYSRTAVMEKATDEITLIGYTDELIVDPSKVVNYRVVYERPTYKAIRASKLLTDADKDFIEFDLVEAASFGYVDAAATFDTIMKRKSKEVVTNAQYKLSALFDAVKYKEVSQLLEKLSGHKLSRRRSRATVLDEHPLRERRAKLVFDDEEEFDTKEEFMKKQKSDKCPARLNATQLLIDYSKLNSEGRRSLVPIDCIFTMLNASEAGTAEAKLSAMKSYLPKLFDNHDATFHMTDRSIILRKIADKTPDNFTQDFVVDELPKVGRYYHISLEKALAMFGNEHMVQLKRLMRNQPKAAAENWIDIANIFERYLASVREATSFGPKLIAALRKLAEGM